MKRIFFGILIFILASCSESDGQTPTTVPATQTSSLTQRPVLTTIIPDDESEGSSIKDIRPTPILTATPIPLSSHYDLPTWLRNPETNIAAALITNDFEKTRIIAFFNATTGERFEILMPKNISGYFWYDNANFGFLADDLKTTFRLDLTIGQVISEIVPATSVRLLEPDWTGRLNGLKIVRESPLSPDFTFTPLWQPSYSKDATFTATKKLNGDGIVVTNNKINKSIWEFTTPKDIYATEFLWSPVDNNILAYIQGKLALPTDLITKEITLNIVDISKGKLLATYSGDFGRMEWSPDGKAILYQNAKSSYSNYGVGFTEAPCILFLNSGEKRCLRSIPRLVPAGYTLATTGRYGWSADNTRIFYTYLYYASQGDYSILGNLCIYDLNNGHIECPTSGLNALIEHDLSYSFSPDENYIYLCISESTILNDYADTAEDSIIKIDGTGFFSWQGTIHDNTPSKICSYDTLWRPLP